MKVMLIYPPETHMIRTNFAEALGRDEVRVYPPLGLLYVAAAAERLPGVEVRVLDAPAEKAELEDIRGRVSDFGPDVVGIQALTFTLIDARQVASAVKSVSGDIHVCVGGAHVNIYPEETMRWGEVDSIVMGEGEYAFAELLECLRGGRSLESVSGIYYRKNGDIVRTEPRGTIENLDDVPAPARHLIDQTTYWSSIAKTRPVTTLMTSRGCPYRCIFCDRPALGKRFRARSAQSVVDEMETCVRDYGIREFFFYDDTFSINRQRVVDICNEILARRLDVIWDVRARVNTVDPALLGLLRKAGCERIHYGVEAGVQRIVDALGKQISLDQAEQVFRWSRTEGIQTLGYFMIGNPGETREDIAQTIEFARHLRPDYAHFAVTTPFPGTALYRMGIEQGLYKTDHWRTFALSPDEGFVPPAWTETLSTEQLRELLREANRSFCLRPGYVLKRLLQVSSIGELVQKARIGWKMLRL